MAEMITPSDHWQNGHRRSIMTTATDELRLWDNLPPALPLLRASANGLAKLKP
jgi:hypothetical protein